jgi:hypothetical protein
VPVATVARLLLATLHEGNQIIAAAADPDDTLAKTSRPLALLLSGLSADSNASQ